MTPIVLQQACLVEGRASSRPIRPSIAFLTIPPHHDTIPADAREGFGDHSDRRPESRWLALCERQEGTISPYRLNPRQKRLNAIRAAAELKKWPDNALRHSKETAGRMAVSDNASSAQPGGGNPPPHSRA